MFKVRVLVPVPVNRCMKLNEVFDDRYYDQLQRDIKRHIKPEREIKPHVSGADKHDASEETSIQDFIISKFEAGQITFQQALAELKKHTPKDEMFFWQHELNMADELLKDE